jgi:hypothetical protein
MSRREQNDSKGAAERHRPDRGEGVRRLPGTWLCELGSSPPSNSELCRPDSDKWGGLPNRRSTRLESRATLIRIGTNNNPIQ